MRPASAPRAPLPPLQMHTAVRSRTLSPCWDEKFTLLVHSSQHQELTLELYDSGEAGRGGAVAHERPRQLRQSCAVQLASLLLPQLSPPRPPANVPQTCGGPTTWSDV